jgi:uncharacterized protein (DUF736 family)
MADRVLVIGAIAVGITAFVRVTGMAASGPIGRGLPGPDPSAPIAAGSKMSLRPSLIVIWSPGGADRGSTLRPRHGDGAVGASATATSWPAAPRVEAIRQGWRNGDAAAQAWPRERTPVVRRSDVFANAKAATVSVRSVQPAPNGLFNGLIWPKDGFASIAYAATARHDFLPLPAAPSFLARQESRACAVLRFAAVASDAPSIASGRSIAIEAAMVRARNGKRRLTMATIGTFKKTGSNEFTGEIVTLSVQAKGVRIVPDLRATGENAPSHRVLVGRAEIGAAWSKRSNEGRDYLGLKLDDPSFNAPIYANLFDDEDGEGYSLIWSRPNGRRGD